MVAKLCPRQYNMENSSPNSRFSVEYLRIPSIEEGKSFFGPVTVEERAWRSDVYFNELLKSPRSRLGIGEHDRAEAYVFGNAGYPQGDNVAHQRHFPISVKVMKADELFIGPDELLELTAYADEFPWEIDDEEIYLHLILNKLILGAGSKLLVKGNVFILNCLKVIGRDVAESQAIIELCSSDSVQHSLASRLTPAKIAEIHGHAGADGERLVLESTPLGMRVFDGSVFCEGQKGGDGGDGVDGSIGANGAMLFLAVLRFDDFVGFSKQSIKLKAGAGHGYPGGKGSEGGNGGNGGKGTSGEITPFGIIKGFRGGSGGCGGHGGNGGRGGHGGLASDIFVSVPPGHSFIFQTETFASLGGTGGDGGKGGNGGSAGANGELYNDDNSGSIPVNGVDGCNGSAGSDGKTRYAPKVHIYEQPKRT